MEEREQKDLKKYIDFGGGAARIIYARVRALDKENKLMQAKINSMY